MLYRINGVIVANFEDYEVEADSKEEAQRKAEANADNFSEWEVFEIEAGE